MAAFPLLQVHHGVEACANTRKRRNSAHSVVALTGTQQTQGLKAFRACKRIAPRCGCQGAPANSPGMYDAGPTSSSSRNCVGKWNVRRQDRGSLSITAGLLGDLTGSAS